MSLEARVVAGILLGFLVLVAIAHGIGYFWRGK